MPDFERIGKRKLDSLLAVFDSVKDIKFPSVLEQLEKGLGPRYEIDKAFLTVFGFDEKEVEAILPEVYATLSEEIKVLKQIMEGAVEEEEDVVS